MRCKTPRGLLWGLLILAIALPASAQPPETTEQSGNLWTFNEGTLSMEAAIMAAEKATGRSFLYSEADIRGTPDLKFAGVVNVPNDRVLEFWQGLFVNAGFAMIPMGPGEGDFIKIEKIDTSRIIKQRAEFVAVDDLERLRYRVGQVVMTSISLKHVEVASVRGAITQIFSARTAEFAQEVPSANAIIVVGFAPTVYAVNQILMAMDRPAQVNALRFEKLALEHAVAEELQPIIGDLITSTSQPGAAGGASRPGEVVVPGQQRPEPKIIADPRTNSLVVYAVESDLNEIKRLVSALDTEVSGLDSNIRIYVLKNSNASDIERTLRDLLQNSTSRSNRGPQGSGGQAVLGEGNQEVVIVADDSTNSLLIQASRTQYERIEPIIRELDRRRPQVLVQTAIIELSETDMRNIAVELTAIEGGTGWLTGGATGFGLSSIAQVDGGTTGDGGGGTGTGGGTGGTTGGSSNPFEGFGRVPFANGEGGFGSFNGLVAGIFDDSFNIPILLQMLETYSRSNLLSNASVLTNDNQRAEISVGRTVYFQQFSTTQAGTDRTQADEAEAALTLAISPHISSDDYLRLEIELVVDAFQGSQDPTSGVPPPTTNRSYTGNVTVQNGKTVVIGGLVQDDESETENKVPWLGDIPLLGELFKSSSKTKAKTTLYLFVTPQIIDDFADLDEISYERKLEIQKLNGQIHHVDPHFRARDLSDMADLEQLEESGYLDVPRYTPVTSFGENLAPEDLNGSPLRPTNSNVGAAANQGGTIQFRDGRVVTDPTPAGQNR